MRVFYLILAVFWLGISMFNYTRYGKGILLGSNNRNEGMVHIVT